MKKFSWYSGVVNRPRLIPTSDCCKCVLSPVACLSRWLMQTSYFLDFGVGKSNSPGEHLIPDIERPVKTSDLPAWCYLWATR
ncbi:hypothetical protein GALMADRAFT_632485 [Galerina marginata CBS 339.88]|uniref:Uncharacterized protein n=1 Tax=Galerina marginata (strain CBS 339.88) TaxID=685588 RepID=A0A067SUP5_GALM3|nr:hypothetical protein GALMADRAFT_632485 [Galerina marginata CBS 339.88]